MIPQPPSNSPAIDRGGTQGQRGYQFQAYSLVYYLLLRRLTFPDLEVSVETSQDAFIQYTITTEGRDTICREYLQCKKRESSSADLSRIGFSREEVRLGDFRITDLKEWTSPVQADILTSNNTFLTVLVLGNITDSLQDYQPPGTRDGFFLGPEFNRNFPVDFEHPQDPATGRRSKYKFAEEIIRRRLRILPMPTPREMEIACRIALEDFYNVPHDSSRATLVSILGEYTRCATSLTPKNKVLRDARLREILSQAQSEGGEWTRVRGWLHEDEHHTANINKGESPTWQDFRTHHYAHREEFDLAISGLISTKFLIVHGYAGAGKTTLSRFLAYSYLKDYPGNEAYYLSVRAGSTLTNERAFFLSKLQTQTLFIIDDEHISPRSVESLLQSFIDQCLLGQVKASVVVISTTTYSNKRLGSSSHVTSALEQASEIRFTPMPSRVLESLLSLLIATCGLRSMAPVRQIAGLSGGKLGTALLIARSASESRNVPTALWLIANRRLHDLLQAWILGMLQHQDPTSFLDQQIIPAFVLHAFDIPPDPSTEEGFQFLTIHGLIGESNNDVSLSFLITQAHLDRIAEIVGSYFERNPRSLSLLFRLLAQSPVGHEPLKAFLQRYMAKVIDAMLDPIDSLDLEEAAVILESVYRISRGDSLYLLREVAAPGGSIRPLFFQNLLASAPFERPRILSRFLDSVFRIDRQIARQLLMLTDLSLQKKIRDSLLSTTTDIYEAAGAIRSIHRCSRQWGVEIFRAFEAHLSSRQIFNELTGSLQGLLSLHKYCREVIAIDRKLVQETIDRSFKEASIIQIFDNADGSAIFWSFLTNLKRLRPRLAITSSRTLMKQRREAVLKRCHESRLIVDYTNTIKSLHRLDRVAGRDLALTTADHAGDLIATESDYQNIASATYLLKGEIGAAYSSALLSRVDRTRVLAGMSGELQKIGRVGISLRNLAEVNADLGGWLAHHLDATTLFQRISNEALYNASHLLNGLLAATPHSRYSEVLAIFTTDKLVADTFYRSWMAERGLVQSSLCLALLLDAHLSKADLVNLLSRGDEGKFNEQILSRINNERSIFFVAHGLREIHRCDETLASEALTVVSQKLEALSAQKAQVKSKIPDRWLPREFQPNNLVDLGTMLRAAAAINPSDALRIANCIPIKQFAQYAVDEPNLGRLAVFVSGMHDASRHLCREFLDLLLSSNQWVYILDEVVEFNTCLHLARVMSRVSRSRGSSFVRLLFERLGTDITEHLELEANLMQCAHWLRLLRLAGTESSFHYLPSIANSLHECIEYDNNIRHLLEAIEALTECGELKAARQVAEKTVVSPLQLSSIGSISDLIRICLKILYIEERLGLTSFAEEMLVLLDASKVRLLVMRELGAKHPSSSVTAAFLCYLFESTGLRRATAMRQGLQEVLGFVCKQSVLQEGVSGYLASLFCTVAGGTVETLDFVRACKKPRDFGLAYVARAALLNKDRVSEGVHAAETLADLQGELSIHSSNLNFGLCLQIPGALELNDGLSSSINERFSDESSTPLLWLLDNCPTLGTRALSYNLWSLTQDTIVKSNHQSWSLNLESSARGRIFRQGQPQDLELISA